MFNEAAQDPSQLSSTFVIGIFTFRQGPAVQLEYLPAMKRGNGKSPILSVPIKRNHLQDC